MTKANAVNLLEEADFRNLVAYYLMLAAKNIHNEALTSDKHTERLALATKIEENVSPYIERFGWRCILNATIQGRSDLAEVLKNDGDIEFVVNSEFDNFI